MPLGQFAGAGRTPKFVAFEHASFKGAEPPGGQPVTEHGGGAVDKQLNVAVQPVAFTEVFDMKINVRQPFAEVNVPGFEDPVKIPNKGAVVFDPL